MNDEELSVEERIKKAVAYALPQVAGHGDADSIVHEIKSLFRLTQEEAAQAYSQMRQQYNRIYERTICRYNLIVLASAGIALLAFTTYLLLGNAIRESAAGIILIVIAVVAILVAAGAMIKVTGIWQEKRYQPFIDRPRLFFIGEREAMLWHAWKLLPMGIFLLVVASFQYLTDQGMLNLNALDTSDPKKIYHQPYWVKIADGKNPQYGYAFSFYEDPQVYQLPDDLSQDGHPNYSIRDVFANDTVQIVYDRKEEPLIRDRYESHKIRIYNIIKEGKPYLDLAQRNTSIYEKNKAQARWGLLGFMLIEFIAVVVLFCQVLKSRQELVVRYGAANRS
ncbi:hypothetical protein [Paraflavitalea pollutisoli]|uniref:hypothetical protein n=1 Tax=Paraflavitalea pollutisoli TaxID=3034143 RepID=UPI0023EDE3BF|nr:hypothetical protein [Paraflavitalea sp. H1-2-19X]